MFKVFVTVQDESSTELMRCYVTAETLTRRDVGIAAEHAVSLLAAEGDLLEVTA